MSGTVDPSLSHDVNELLGGQVICTVSTIGHDGTPNAATVAFMHTPEMDFVFSTDESTRKATNISRDGRVAITVTDGVKLRTLQLEGTAKRLTKDEFEATYAQRYFDKLPFTSPMMSNPAQAFYVVTPLHMKFTDISVKPWRVETLVG